MVVDLQRLVLYICFVVNVFFVFCWDAFYFAGALDAVVIGPATNQ
jgi:hypothetical protein